MKSSDSPFLADLFTISFRWLILFGFVISLSIDRKLDWLALVVIGGPAVWNIFVATLASMNRRLPAHRAVNIAVDLLSALLLFALTGGVAGPLIWSGVLAILSAAMYYEIRGAAVVSVLVSVLQTALTYVQAPERLAGPLLPTILIINLAAGLASASFSIPLLRRLRRAYQNTLRQRKEVETRVQRTERERMKALFEITETLSGTLNYHTVLQSTLDGANTAIGAAPDEARGLLSAFLLFNEGQLRMAASRGFPNYDQNLSLPADAGALNDVLRNGTPRLLADPDRDVELSGFIALQETGAAFIIPLIRGLNAFGILLFAHPDISFFTPERCDMLEMVSNQAVIAIQNARLFQDLSLEKERILQTQEEAQKKLARDLHDGPTQSVSAIAMRLNIARKLLERSPAEAAGEILKVEELARRTTSEIRHMLFTLRPLILETEGLEAALGTIAEKMRDLYQQNVSLDIDPLAVRELDMPRQTVVFYLCEEAVNNARKHAQAAQITIHLRFVQNEHSIVALEISDNGSGFDLKQVLGSYERRGSLGMVSLRERSELINALLKVESSPGQGTRIRVFIPLDQDAIDRLHRLR